MTLATLSLRCVLAFGAACTAADVTFAAATPTVEQALKLAPVQKEVAYDRPEGAEIGKCKIVAEKVGEQTGWVVRNAQGDILRRFLDTNGDNVVDVWCYFAEGVEVYRDIDANFNTKADQYRWFNTAGSRSGDDTNEDGAIDAWKMISAEEVTAELVLAIAERDEARFRRLLLTADELAALGLGEAKSRLVGEQLRAADASFLPLASRQQAVTAKTAWINFSGTLPGVVPAGTEGSTRDIMVYENVMAMTETGEKNDQFAVGTLVRSGEAWRLIGIPTGLGDGAQQAGAAGFFYRSVARTDAGGEGNAGEAEAQALLDQLQKLDQSLEAAADPTELAKLHADRANLLEKISAAVSSPEERGQWLRQLGDTVSAATQAGAYPEGVARLKQLIDALAGRAEDADLVAYLEFRYRAAEYGASLLQPNADFGAIQTRWIETLKKYVADHPQSPDTSEALLQLAIGQEFAGDEQAALQFYGQIAKDFPSAPPAKKAAGAIKRLTSVGKPLTLTGQSVQTGKAFDLAQLRGRVVLVHYWATTCEPCKVDLAQLKEMQAKYGKAGFDLVGVSLDVRREDLLDYLKTNRLPWTQMFEQGGLDSRLANELGISTMPTMLLLDKQGKVVNRSIHVTEIDREVRDLLKK